MYPLSPAQNANLNRSPSPRRYDDYEVRKYAMTATDNADEDGDTMSSPLISNTSALTTGTSKSEQENTRSGSSQSNVSGGNITNTNNKNLVGYRSLSPAKRRHSRVISGTEPSPLKLLSRKRSSEEALAEEAEGSMGPPPARNPRKISASPEKRFPVRIGGEEDREEGSVYSQRRMMHERQVSLEDAMRKNGGLRHAIDIFEDEEGEEQDEKQEEGAAEDGKEEERPATATSGAEDASMMGGCGADDTMASTFSTFSAVPTLATFANLRREQQSPAKLAGLAGVTGSSSSRPSTRDESGGNTTNLLMDFTESLRHPRRSPEKRAGLPSSMTAPNLNNPAATPSKAATTLIDFDIPPLPTPRSVPSISSREVESLKSGFLSEISSLKASLSGKEAEVQSLKTAVGDAEKRVGESMEQLREESALREQMGAEKEDWERRGREMESVLRKLRDEMVNGQREREEAERKLEESEKRREAAEILHQEAESKIAGLRAGKDTAESSATKSLSPQQNNKEVELAVERVARELHALYKGKHETKVTALKKSYEARWEKKVKALESRVAEVEDENATLRAGQNSDDTVLMAQQANAEADKEQASRDRVAIRELHASVQRLEAEVASVQGDNANLRGELERERVEKGELVQLAEEMMSMQSFVGKAPGGSEKRPAMPQEHTQRPVMPQEHAQRPVMPQEHMQRPTMPPEHTQQYSQPSQQQSNVTKTPGKRPLSLQTTTPGRRTSLDNRRGSLGKASGLRAPGSAYRGGSGGNSLAGAPTPRIPGRSGIMSSIEKMGMGSRR